MVPPFFMFKNRIAYVDIAKGLAIWLMVIGHMDISEQIRIYIYSFHMPLFFILSGLFFKRDRPFLINLKSSIKSILWPYFTFSVINLFVCWVSPYLHPELYYDMHGKEIFFAAIRGIFLGTDQITPTSFMPLGALWFLVSLFTIQVLTSALAALVRNNRIFLLMATIIPIALFLVTRTNMPFSVRSSMMAMPFYCLGYALRDIDFSGIPHRGYFFMILALFFVFIIPLNGFCTIDECIYGKSILLFYVNAVIATIMVLVACSFIAGKRISRYLELIGQQTLVILGMHAFPMIVMKVAGVLFFGNAVLSSLPFILLVSVVVLVVSYMMGIIISKYAPFMLSPRTTY